MRSQRSFPHSLPASFQLVENSERGALPRSIFYPTHASLRRTNTPNAADNAQSESQPLHGQGLLNWNSKRQRKAHAHPKSKTYSRPEYATLPWYRKLARMHEIQYWNISWWIAVLFTIGSIVWCANGFIVFLPFIRPDVPPNMVSGGWTAWVGATIFFFASWPAIWEVWNKDDGVSFGWGVYETAELKKGLHYHDGTLDVEKNPSAASDRPQSNEFDQNEKQQRTSGSKKWIWFTTSTEYWHDIGFLAALSQALGATIFWISGFTGISTINETLGVTAQDVIYWTPQVVGGSGFIIAALLGLIESQHRWYIPAINDLSWQTSFFNLIGGTGFMLCGVFGYGGQSGQGISWMAYQSSLCTFWGSFAFLIASVMQWWEAVNLN